MKKFLGILALALVLCLACVGAVAEGTHEHNFDYNTPYYVSLPSATQTTGIVRFKCTFADEYGTDDTNEFQEFVVYPTDHDLPETLEEALALQGTDRVANYNAPNCTETGSITIKCAHAAQELAYDGVHYTGWTGTCNETKTFTIPATGHTWGSAQNPPQYLNIKPATCTETGIVQDYCLVCGEKGDQIVTDKEEHTPGDREVTQAATCVATGTRVKKCTVCGEVQETEEIPIDTTAHEFGEWVVEKETPATCTATGERVEYRLCKICLDAKEVRTVTLDALGHDEENKVEVTRVAATCAATGSVTYKCPRCGEVIDAWTETLPVDPDAHPEEYVEKTATQAPTCTQDGKNTYVCHLCGKEWTETIEKLGHIEKTIELDGRCAKTEADEFKAMTVTYCTRENCDQDEDEVENANYVRITPYYSAQFPTDLVKIVKVVEGSVPAHEWSDWTMRNSYNQNGDTPAYWIRQCDVCGKPDELIVNNDSNPNEANAYCMKNGHTAGEAVKENVVEATTEADGSYDLVVYCTVCGEEISRETVTVAKVKDGLTKDDDGVWRLYEDGEVSSATKIVEYDGAEFWVVNGVVPSDASGLTICPDGKAYFLAYGQILRDANDFAMYNNEWFMLKNGELDTSANGLYDYNGGRFVFAAGKLNTSLSGLWQNPQDNKFYYLINGQVSDHSGVAAYGNRFFVVENGILDTDYNGTIEYSGHTFEVVNGQLGVNPID